MSNMLPRGYKKGDCYNCLGRGTMDCPMCNGGRDCKVCNGRGWIVCPRCKGSGKE
ncbi:MAG: hypothetical protein ACI4FV_08300 [Lachnospiraceae bacterium]